MPGCRTESCPELPSHSLQTRLCTSTGSYHPDSFIRWMCIWTSSSGEIAENKATRIGSFYQVTLLKTGTSIDWVVAFHRRPTMCLTKSKLVYVYIFSDPYHTDDPDEDAKVAQVLRSRAGIQTPVEVSPQPTHSCLTPSRTRHGDCCSSMDWRSQRPFHLQDGATAHVHQLKEAAMGKGLWEWGRSACV